MCIEAETSSSFRQGRWPDFIGLGMAKSGTTWLFDMLSEHSEIDFARGRRDIDYCYPPIDRIRLENEPFIDMKEVQFWNDIYLPFNQKKRFIDAYRELFRHVPKNHIAGEITNNYLFYMLNDDTLKEFHACLPQVKLIVCLRNPVDRYISHHFFQYDIGERHRKMGLKTYYSSGCFPSLDDEIGKIVCWLKSPGQKNVPGDLGVRNYIYGLYAIELKNILRYFDRDQLHIIFFDDIKQRPSEVLNQLSSFLGVTDFQPINDVGGAVNVTQTRKTVTDEQRRALKRLYRESVHQLSGMLNRNLDHWI